MFIAHDVDPLSKLLKMIGQVKEFAIEKKVSQRKIEPRGSNGFDWDIS